MTYRKDTLFNGDLFSFIDKFGIYFNPTDGKLKKVEKLVNFETQILNHILNNNWSIIKKTRQMRVSTLVSYFCAWKMLSTQESIGVVYCNVESSRHLKDLVKEILVNFLDINTDFSIKISCDKLSIFNNKTKEIVGGYLEIRRPKITHIRGCKFDNTILGECAFNKDEKLFNYILSRNIDTKVIAYSTPNGYNKFKEVWDSYSMSRLEINYKMNPDYFTKDKIDQLRIMMSSIQFKQEMDGEFIDKYVNSKMVSLRLDFKMYENMCLKINPDTSVTDYIKGLIEKDIMSI